VPGIYELLGGAVRLQQLRDVQIEDLLRRAPIQIDAAQVAALLRGQARPRHRRGRLHRLRAVPPDLRCSPASLILLGHGENSIFDISNELKVESSNSSPNLPTFNLLTCNRSSLTFASPNAGRGLRGAPPEIVFHTAAHKHVP
jgi:FlaA1/EpsC-like NDP-sugar epimerase